MDVGIDIIDNERIAKLLDRLSLRILSEEEYDIFINLNNKSRKIEFLAGRWAVKEALYKVLGNKFNSKKYSILPDQFGKPYVKTKENNFNYKISISHTKLYTIAIAIIN